MKYVITFLLAAILALLIWFLFLKADPCVTLNKLSSQRKQSEMLFKPLIIPVSDAELKARFACARSLK